jgi:hypothetical protein
MTKGSDLVAQIKQHVVDNMRAEAACVPGRESPTNVEIEELCDLALHLRSQDSYLTYSPLHSLINDGVVEKVVLPRKRPKYRLR